MAASNAVNLSINFLDGSKETIVQPVVSENGDISYPGLLSSINLVQKQSNQRLTEVIEDEKSKRAKLNSTAKLEIGMLL